MAGTILGAGSRVVNKMEKKLALLEPIVLRILVNIRN